MRHMPRSDEKHQRNLYIHHKCGDGQPSKKYKNRIEFVSDRQSHLSIGMASAHAPRTTHITHDDNNNVIIFRETENK